jgi:orotidine-5'-phosphate decarboxylase
MTRSGCLRRCYRHPQSAIIKDTMSITESMVRVNAGERLIFALDVASISEARRLVQQLDGVVSFFKIGLELHVSSGSALIPEILQQNKQIFLDLKFFDVPETVKRAVEKVASLSVSFLTIHGNGKIIEAAVEGRGSTSLKLLAVTVLTSLDSDDIRDLGFPCPVSELVLHRAKKALEAGCDGVITSPQEAGKVRELAEVVKAAGVMKPKGHKFLIVTPGVRPGNSAHDDHKRLASPTDAIHAGADYLVIGRPIREAPDPRQAAQSIIAEMQTAFDSR